LEKNKLLYILGNEKTYFCNPLSAKWLFRCGFSESYQEQPIADTEKSDSINESVAEQGPLLDREEIRNSEEYQAGGFALPVNADYALANGWTGKGVKIAFFDDLIDIYHKEFEYAEGDATCDNCTYYFTHGTHVAGIAAADYGDGGMTGIAPDATVYSVPIFDEHGMYTANNNGISYLVAKAVDDNVKIFNNSWGGIVYDPMTLADLAKTFDEAQDEGAIFVWARGNYANYDEEGNDFARLPIYFPELEEQWIAVTNVVEKDGEWVLSTDYNANKCGDAKDFCIAAPGTEIYSAERGTDGYTTISGTSMSAPVVSGALAVLMQAFPYLESDVLVDLIFSTARDLGDEDTYGHGMLDIEAAMTFQGEIPTVAMSRVVTTNESVGENFEQSVQKLAVVDDYSRAYTIDPSLLTINTKDNEITFGENPELSEHFKNISKGLFYKQGIITVGVGLDEQYAVAVSSEHIEVGAIYDNRQGRLPGIITTGDFSTGDKSITGYVRLKDEMKVNDVTLSLSGEAGVTRSFGSPEKSLRVYNPIVFTYALKAGLTYKSLTGYVALPVSVSHGEVTYLIPVDHLSTQEETKFSMNYVAVPEIGLEYDLDYGKIGAKTNLKFDTINGYMTINF